jgi:hypothetical protein
MHVPLHIGLPSAKIDSVVVRWPDGKIETLKNIKPNTTNNIVYQAQLKDTAFEEHIKTVFSATSGSLPYNHISPK